IEQAQKCLAVIDAGLVSGLGQPKPGKMCVEAAICYALGLPHSDNPGCVSKSIRSFKISLNDKEWSSNERSEEHTSELQSRFDLATLSLHDALPILSSKHRSASQ